MNIDLHGRRAFVTGSTAGIGPPSSRNWRRPVPPWWSTGAPTHRFDHAMTRLRGEVLGASVNGVAADAGSAEGAHALIAAAPEATSSSTMSASSR